METYVPFIHHLKAISCLYQQTGMIISANTLIASGLCNTFKTTSVRSSSSYLCRQISKQRKSSHLDRQTAFIKSGRNFKPVKCCNVIFKTPFKLRKHQNTLKHLKKMKCSLCNELFNNKEEIRDHKISKHGLKGNKKIICQICNAELQSRDQFAEHLRSLHSSLIFQCSVCSYVSLRKKRLSRHIKVWNHGSFLNMEEKPKKSVECCGRVFRYASHLKRHRETLAHQNKGKSCYTCKEDFESKEALELHQCKGKRKFSCMICEKHFATNGILKTHMDTLHLMKTFYECSRCPFGTYKKCSLARHCKSKHIKKDMLCDKCGLSFSRTDSLNTHVRKVHVEKVPWCSICHYAAPDFESLETHKAVHRPCQICGMTFKWIKYRELHMKAHLRGKDTEKLLQVQISKKVEDEAKKSVMSSNDTTCDNHQSSQCVKKTNISTCLSIETIPDDETEENKLPICSTCHYRSQDFESLERHKTVHQPCHICGMTFKRLVRRENHIKGHERDAKMPQKGRRKAFKDIMLSKDTPCNIDLHVQTETPFIEDMSSSLSFEPFQEGQAEVFLQLQNGSNV